MTTLSSQPEINFQLVSKSLIGDPRPMPQMKYIMKHNLDVVDMIANENRIISMFVDFVWQFMIDTDFKDRITIELEKDSCLFGTVSYLKENFRVEYIVQISFHIQRREAILLAQ